MTGSGDLTISTTTLGTTVSDGTVTWTIGKDLCSVTGEFYGDRINRDRDSSLLTLCGGKTTQKGGFIRLYGQSSGGAGKVEMSAAGYDNDNNLKVASLQIKKDGSLFLYPTSAQSNTAYDIAGSAIVAKSLGTNGYIKYASGLIVQWGSGFANNTGGYTNQLPISFDNKYSVITIASGGSDATNNVITIGTKSLTEFKSATSYPAAVTIEWLAIGY
jgi:hypothetical protein